MPPIFAASSREAPSSTAAIANSRRACAASFARWANRRTSPAVLWQKFSTASVKRIGQIGHLNLHCWLDFDAAEGSSHATPRRRACGKATLHGPYSSLCTAPPLRHLNIQEEVIHLDCCALSDLAFVACTLG